jgi:membrane protease YdiL (CAAX protease family)
MLIDLGIAWIVLAVAANVLIPGAIGNNPTPHETATLGAILAIVITLWFNYIVIGEWRWGRTLGKAALGIRVVGEDGGGVTWNRALGRNLLLVVDLLAGLVLIPMSGQRQRLGDRAAHTIVLTKRRPEVSAVQPAPAPPDSTPPPNPPPSWTGPTAGGPGPTWGPGRVGVGLLALLLTTVVEVGVVSAFDSDLSSLGARLAAQALLAVTLIGVAFVVTADRGGIAPRQALGLRAPRRPPFRPVGLAYLGYVAFAIAYSLLIHPHQKDVTRDLGFGHGTVGTIAAGLLIVVAAPVSEEIFFRGFIFGGLRGRLSFPIAGLISAGIFGLFHFTGAGSLGVLPQLAVLGFALCWVYEETGSIYPTMAMHALNNAIAFALLTS